MAEDYVQEAHAERQSDANQQLTADLQEAANIRYGVWLRLAVLSSGNWAVYSGRESGGGLETGVISIHERLDPEYLRGLSVNEQAKAEEQLQLMFEAFTTRTSAEPQVASRNLEDMGL